MELETDHAPSAGKTAVQPAQLSIICNCHVSGSEMWLFTELGQKMQKYVLPVSDS
jgi:hypothetical protein